MSGSKPLLRKLVKSRLTELSVENIHDQSHKVFRKIQELDIISPNSVVCIYISMNNEVAGKGADDMVMFHVKDIEQLEAFPKNSWGIPEPPLEIVQASDPNEFVNIDVVFMPGVAFDKRCNRIGHGKGYYDSFVRRLTEKRLQQGLLKPTLIGLSLQEQIVDEVPIEPHDRQLDYIVTMNEVFTHNST